MQEMKRDLDRDEALEMGDRNRQRLDDDQNQLDENEENKYLPPFWQTFNSEEKQDNNPGAAVLEQIAEHFVDEDESGEVVSSSSSSVSRSSATLSAAVVSSSSSMLVPSTTQQGFFGQLAKRPEDRHLTLSLPGGTQPIWKQAKPFYQKLSKLNGLTQQQVTLSCLIRDKLLEALTLCDHIAKGNCYDIAWVKSSRTLDMIQAAGAAGGLVHFIGGEIVFGNLVFSALRTGLREFNKHNVMARAKLIQTFTPSYDDMLLLSSNVAVVIAIVYAQSITKLTDDSLKIFSNYLVNRMIHHIATSRGKDDGYLKSIGNTLFDSTVNLFKSVVRSLDASFFPIRDKDDGPREKIMLEAILCYQPTFSERVKLSRRHEFTDGNDYTIEGILSTAILTPEGKVYSSSDAQPEKYGYRYLNQVYAESIGYTLCEPEYQSRMIQQ